MIRAAVLALAAYVMLTAPATAQPPAAVVGFVASPADRAEWEVGVISIRNLVANPDYETIFAVATPLGDVVLSYTSTPNNGPDPADVVVILSVPDGYVAVPADLRVDEAATAEIRIIRFSGA